MKSRIVRLMNQFRGAVRRRRQWSRSPVTEQFESRRLLAATLVADLNPTVTELGPVIYDYGLSQQTATLNGDLYYVDEIDYLHRSLERTGPGGTETVLTTDAYWLTTVGDNLFFSGADAEAGQELFVTDGTAVGTRMLKDINPGGNSNPSLLTPAGNRVFFTADTPLKGTELWVSDGTEAGTRLVKDLLPGPGSSFIQNLTAAGDTVYFSAWLPHCGQELFRSDGTIPGTRLVADIDTQSNGSFPQDLVAVGNLLYFTVQGSAGRELWVSDGLATGTVPVLDGNGQRVTNVRSATALGSSLMFSGSSEGGDELWRATGSAASLVRDIVPGVVGSSPGSLTVLGSLVYFVADDGVHGQELWASDGTETGTAMVTDLNPSGGSGVKYLSASSNLLYFTADDGLSGISVWRSDGSATGTLRLGDMLPGMSLTWSDDPLFTSVGDGMYFQADDGVVSGQIWLTDGTAAGTQVVSTPLAYSDSSSPAWLTELDGSLWFTAMNQNFTDNVNALYVSDGTESGTVRFVEPVLSDLAFIEDPRKINGRLVFTAFDSQFRRQMWTTDGSVAGTVPVTNFSGSGLVQYANIVEFNNELYFAADDGVNGSELYATDGTPAGTRLVRDINPGPDSGSNFGNLGPAAILGNMLYFAATNGADGMELWRTDGTTAGTQMVSDLAAGSEGSYPSQLVVCNGRLLFSAAPASYQFALWSTDGTSAGTGLVVDLSCDSLTVVPGPVGQANSDLLYFRAYDSAYGTELWRSDGTAQGTSLAMDLYPGPMSSWIPVMVAGPATHVAGGDLYFITNDGTHGYEPWVARGDSVSLLKDINPGRRSSWLSLGSLTVAGDLVYLAADDGVHGLEPWQSDGTPEGTQLVADINSTGLPDDYMGMALVDDTVFFSTRGPAGTELYRAPFNHRPSSVALTGQQVAENRAAGTVVGTLSATDPDAGDTAVFSLVSGTGDTDNGLFVIQNGVLKTQALFNYESRSSYSIRVRATDSNGQSRDQVFSISVTNEIELQGLDVQLGQSQRSYVRYVDLLFAGAQDVSDLLSGGWNQFRVMRSTLDNTLPVNVPLSSSMISQSRNAVRFDFGANGLGGNRNTNAGDGYYELAWDRSRNGSFTAKKYFYRLLGDVNGDRRVDSLDSSLVTGSLGLANPERDVNGDGLVNANDRTLVLRAVGRKLKDGLFTDD